MRRAIQPMNAVFLLSLLVSSLGIEAVFVSSWLCAVQGEMDRDIEEEDEILMGYEPEENNPKSVQQVQPNGNAHSSPVSEWEYKIVRSNRDIFRNLATFQQLCKEEAEHGWILLEKLDDRRVRFKRPVSMRDRTTSANSRLDPYRSYYGSSNNPASWLAVLAFLTAILLPAYLGFALVASTLNPALKNAPSIPNSVEQQEDLSPPETPENQEETVTP